MKTDIILNENERIDDLQIRGLRIIQNPDLFCFGIDAVLLSYYARAKEGDRVIDLCTGNGAIPILMSAKTDAESFTGLEIQEGSADLARRSVILNGLEDRINIVCGDLKNAVELFGGSSFEVLTVNPPYMTEHHGLVNPDAPKAIARHELLCSLEDVISVSAGLLKPQGLFFMVHRPHRLVDIFSLMRKYGIEPKRMRMVHPYADKEPNMVLIEGSRGGRSNLITDPPLFVYKDKNVYTDEIYEIYSNA
ncbi:MAG: tRNA1(Val) (adenine(37)-N6)-methyltransferase [Lachnospiraceae bacterium]|nr:tRNA1(Val) (adenine(37)-N6)-methyltransferase [Lachnospiraceae bacterium]